MNNQETSEKPETIKGDGKEEAPSDEKDSAETDTNANELTPVKHKIGERPGNLKKRSEWFQKRRGRG